MTPKDEKSKKKVPFRSKPARSALILHWDGQRPVPYGANMSPAQESDSVVVERDGPVEIITINRPKARNAVDGPTAALLYQAFSHFDEDQEAAVAILTGADGTFCSGADLKAIATDRGNRIEQAGADRIVGQMAPMGPTRMLLSKPVIAAVEGYAVAGGLELAVWCDLRVAADSAVFGVFCRRWGVPLVDGGTVRLPRLIGGSRAMDLILTGREVAGAEAMTMGLANRLCRPGETLETARALAHELAALPPRCLRSDRTSAYQQWGLDLGAALANETELGLATVRSGETQKGAARFAAGVGRHGAPGPGVDPGRGATEDDGDGSA
jgi:enoyl-CoA hydratase